MTPPLQQAVEALHGGGVVLHATEGVWGFACDPMQPSAVQKIFAIKGRQQDKGLILIGADAEIFAAQLAAVDAEHAAQVRASWPGHHTWILPDSTYPADVTGGRGTIACRVPGHEQARQLCAAFGGALVSTSANRSGQPPVMDFHSAQAAFAELVDFVLPGEVGEAGRASVIHDLSGAIVR